MSIVYCGKSGFFPSPEGTPCTPEGIFGASKDNDLRNMKYCGKEGTSNSSTSHQNWDNGQLETSNQPDAGRTSLNSAIRLCSDMQNNIEQKSRKNQQEYEM